MFVCLQDDLAAATPEELAEMEKQIQELKDEVSVVKTLYKEKCIGQ